MVQETVITFFPDDDVVNDVDVEEFPCSGEFLGQQTVFFAWSGASRWMVVAEDEGGSADVDGILENDFRVGNGMSDSAFADAFSLEHLVVLVEVHDEEMLLPRVVDKEQKMLVGSGRVFYDVVGAGFGDTSALAQFQSGHDGNSLGLADAFVLHQVAEGEVGKLNEVVADAVEDGTRKCYRRLCGVARTDEDGDEFGVAQCRLALVHHLLAWAVVASPLFDAFPFVRSVCAFALHENVFF